MLLALSGMLIGATVLPTVLCCQAAAHMSGATDTHECCEGGKHGAACPLGKSPTPPDPGCPVMQSCDTDDGLLMRLLGQVGFLPGPQDTAAGHVVVSNVVTNPGDAPNGFAPNPEPPPPRV